MSKYKITEYTIEEFAGKDIPTSAKEKADKFPIESDGEKDPGNYHGNIGAHVLPIVSNMNYRGLLTTRLNAIVYLIDNHNFNEDSYFLSVCKKPGRKSVARRYIKLKKLS